MASGKIYASTDAYTSSSTVPLGNKLYCINATTGAEIWNIEFAGGSKVIADSELLATNDYDGLLYAFDQGPTSTSVSVMPALTTNGTQLLIQGYVLDESLGQPGTPCVSDQDMSAYMQFFYMQQPCPLTVIGVPVELRAITASGSIIEITKSTPPTNLYGLYSYLWTPPGPGNYTIVARYLGDGFLLSVLFRDRLICGSSTANTNATSICPKLHTNVLGIIAALIVSIVIGLYSIYDHRKLGK